MPKEIMTIKIVRDLPDGIPVSTNYQIEEDKKELESLLKEHVFPMSESISVSYEVQDA